MKVLHNRGISYLLTDHRSGMFFRAVHRRYSIHDALSIRGISGRALGRRAAAVRNDEVHLTGSNVLQSLMSSPPLARNERADSSFREVTILYGSGHSRFAQVWIHRQARGALFVGTHSVSRPDREPEPERRDSSSVCTGNTQNNVTALWCGSIRESGHCSFSQYHCQQTRNSFCVRTPRHPPVGWPFVLG
jgi:hypothetical protein